MSDITLAFYKPWQKQAILHMASECSNKPGIALFHDMGSGKTLSSLMIAHQFSKPVVVICPPTLISQWHDEVDKTKLSQRTEIVSMEELNSIVSTNLSSSVLIIDEVHLLLNILQSMGTKNMTAILNVLYTPFRRIVLTGTPIFNDELDMMLALNVAAGKPLFPLNKNEFDEKYYKVRGATAVLKGWVSPYFRDYGFYTFLIGIVGTFANIMQSFLLPMTDKMVNIKKNSHEQILEKIKDKIKKIKDSSNYENLNAVLKDYEINENYQEKDGTRIRDYQKDFKTATSVLNTHYNSELFTNNLYKLLGSLQYLVSETTDKTLIILDALKRVVGKIFSSFSDMLPFDSNIKLIVDMYAFTSTPADKMERKIADMVQKTESERTNLFTDIAATKGKIDEMEISIPTEYDSFLKDSKFIRGKPVSNIQRVISSTSTDDIAKMLVDHTLDKCEWDTSSCSITINKDDKYYISKLIEDVNFEEQRYGNKAVDKRKELREMLKLDKTAKEIKIETEKLVDGPIATVEKGYNVFGIVREENQPKVEKMIADNKKSNQKIYSINKYEQYHSQVLTNNPLLKSEYANAFHVLFGIFLILLGMAIASIFAFRSFRVIDYNRIGDLAGSYVSVYEKKEDGNEFPFVKEEKRTVPWTHLQTGIFVRYCIGALQPMDYVHLGMAKSEEEAQNLIFDLKDKGAFLKNCGGLGNLCISANDPEWNDKRGICSFREPPTFIPPKFQYFVHDWKKRNQTEPNRWVVYSNYKGTAAYLSAYLTQERIDHKFLRNKTNTVTAIEEFEKNEQGILILDDELYYGISIKKSTMFHILDVPSQPAMISQLRGRVVRLHSHDKGGSVTIVQWVSILPRLHNENIKNWMMHRFFSVYKMMVTHYSTNVTPDEILYNNIKSLKTAESGITFAMKKHLISENKVQSWCKPSNCNISSLLEEAPDPGCGTESIKIENETNSQTNKLPKDGRSLLKSIKNTIFGTETNDQLEPN